MQAVILAGGKSTRLKPLTDNLPKQLVKIDERTILEHIIDLFKKYGITDITLTVQYLAEMMKDYCGDGSRFGVKISYLEEKEPLGTAGGLRILKDQIKESFFVSNGDELKDLNLDEMLEQHRQQQSLATIAVNRVPDPHNYGCIIMKGKKITKFLEKSRDLPTNKINSGLYLFEPEVIDYISEGYVMFEKDILPKLAAEGKLNGFLYNGQWYDTGTIEKLEHTRKNWQPLLVDKLQ